MQSASRRAILPRAILIAGVLLAAGQLLPVIPHEHTLVLVLGHRVDSVVRRIDLSWTRQGSAEPHGGVTLTFPSGGAPRTVRQSITAPSGHYLLDLTLERERRNARDSNATKNYVKRVELQGSETKIHIEDDAL